MSSCRLGPSQLATSWRAHDRGICCLAWSPTGEALASGGNEGALWLWDQRGQRLGGPTARQHGSIRSIDWAPDGRMLIVGAEDAEVIIVDAQDWSVLARHRDHARWVNAVAWAPAGHGYASASGDGTIRVYTSTDHALERELVDGFGACLSLAWSPDSRLLAVSRRSGAVTVWRTGHWNVLRTLSTGSGAVWSIAWTSDGRYLWSGGADGRILLWDIQSGQVNMAIEGHGDTVARVSTAAGGRLLASLSHDESIALWRCSDGQLLTRWAPVYPGWVSCLTFHPHQPLVAATDRSGCSIEILDLRQATGTSDAAALDAPYTLPTRAVASEYLQAQKGRGSWSVDLAIVASEVEQRFPGSGYARNVVRCAAWQEQTRGRLIVSGDARRGFLQTHTLEKLTSDIVAYARSSLDGSGVVPLSSIPYGAVPDVSREELEEGLLHYIVRHRYGWLQRAGEHEVLCLPGAATRQLPHQFTAALETGVRWRIRGNAHHAPVVMTRLLQNTLFRRFCLFDSGLCAEDDSNNFVLLTWHEERAEAMLLVCRRDGEAPRRELAILTAYVEVILRDLGLHPERVDNPTVTPFGDVLQHDWQQWDGGELDTWATSMATVMAQARDPVSELQEQADDEWQRQLRRCSRRARLPSDVDVVLCHIAADEATARQIQAELADAGITAWIDQQRVLESDPPDPSLLRLAEAAGAVAIIIGRGMDRPWREQPFHPFYSALTRARPGHMRRLRWLPVRLPDAPAHPQVPDFLYSFDWLAWTDASPYQRRASVVNAIAAVTHDRARL